MKPLELLRISMAASVCGSIFLAMHIWPLLAVILGTTLFVGGLALTGWVVFYLIKARESEQFRRIFGKSTPAPAEIRAWRNYVKGHATGLRTTNVKRFDPRSLFYHCTVPDSDIPRRATAHGPLKTDDRPRAAYWTVN